MADKLTYKIELDASQATKTVDSFRRRLTSTVSDAGSSAGRDVFSGVISGARSAESAIGRLSNGFLSLRTIAAGAAAAVAKGSIDSATTAERAFKGLESVANRTGSGIEKAWAAVEDLTSDGVLSQTEAATALKNLFAYGITDVDKAVSMIERLKDAAAFGRQASLAWGEAIVSATEGIKNENSVLVDNAGVTKNVAKMYEEYADKLGVTYNNLTEAQKQQAIYNGILRETENQVGDAQKALGGLDGSTSQLSKSFTDFKVALGDQLTPAFNALQVAGAGLLDYVLTPMVNIGGALIKTFTAVTGLVVDVIQAFNKAETFVEFDAELRRRGKAQSAEIAGDINRGLGRGKSNEGPTSRTQVKDDIDPAQIERKAKEKAEAEAKAAAKQELASAEKALNRSKQAVSDELAVFKAGLAAQQAALDLALEKGTLSREVHARRSSELELGEHVKAANRRIARVAELERAADLAARAGDQEKEADIDAQIAAENSAAEAAKLSQQALRAKGAKDAIAAAKESAAERLQIEEQLLQSRHQAEQQVQDAVNAREAAENEAAYVRRLVTHEQYLRRQGDLSQQALTQEKARIEELLAFEQSRRPVDAKDAAAQRGSIEGLNAQLLALEERRKQVTIQTDAALAQSAVELANLRKGLERDLMEAEGRSLDARSAQIDHWLEEKRREFAGLQDMLAKVEQVASAQHSRVSYDRAQEGVSDIRSRYAVEDRGIERRRNRGEITDYAAEHESLQAQRRQAEELRAQLARLEQFSDGSSASRQAIEALRADITDLESSFSATAQGINDNFFASIEQGFQDLLSGAKSFGDVLRNIFSKLLSDIAALFLRQGLQSMLGPLTSGGGGIGGMVMGALASFGGFREKGGDALAGKFYVTGEAGPELFFPGMSGRVVSNADIQQALSSMVSRPAASPVKAAMPAKSYGQVGGGSTTVQNSITPRVFVASSAIIASLREDPEFERFHTELTISNGRKIQSAW